MSEQLQKALSDEAIATYAVFLAGVLVTILGWLLSRYLNRKRPRQVKLLRTEERSLLEISPALRDHVKVHYKEQETKSIFFTQFQLQNSGDEIIENIKLIAKLSEAKIFGSTVIDPILDRKEPTEISFQDNNLHVQLPYINPKRLYNDKVIIEVLSEKPLKILEIQGGGREWIASHIDLVGLELQLNKELMSIQMGGGIGGAIEAISDYLIRITPLLINIRRSQR